MECHACHSAISDDAVYCPYCGEHIPGTEECQDYTYEAFISYRHLSLDQSVAKRLQRFLEGLKAPKNLETSRAKKRLGKLFRDEDELPTSGSLSNQIENALKHARYLVVVCTPQTPESLWVQREVEMFASLHGRGRIIVALADGEPTDSFPPLLLQQRIPTPDGECKLVETEPIAADFRASAQKKFKDEALRIAASLFGCNYDDLRQRMRTRRIQTIAIVAGIIAAVSIAFGAFSLYQQVQIQENHRISQIHESELLATESERLLKQGNRYQAIQVALQALPESSQDSSRPFVPAASLALQRAIGLYPAEIWTWTPCYSLPVQSNSDFAICGDFIAVTTSNETVEVYETLLGAKLYTVDRESLSLPANAAGSYFGGMALLGDKLVCAYDNHIVCLEAKTGDVIWKSDCGNTVSVVEGGTDVVSALVIRKLYHSDKATPIFAAGLQMFDLSDGKLLQSFELDNVPSLSSKLFTSQTGEIAACASPFLDVPLVVCDSKGKRSTCTLAGRSAVHVFIDDDIIYAISGDSAYYGKRYVEAFDTALSQKWAFEDSTALSASEHGTPDASGDAVCGIDQNANRLVVALANALICLDADTGKEASRSTLEKPILACDFIPYAQGILAFGMLSNGKAFLTTGEADSEISIAQEVMADDLAQANVDINYSSDLHSVRIAGKTVSPNNLAVFNLGAGIVASLGAKNANWLPADANGKWENGRIAILGKAGISLLDPATLQIASSAKSSALPNLDWTAEPMVALAENDDTYVFGHTPENPDDLALYRLAPNGEVAAKTVLENALYDISKATDAYLPEDRLRISNDNQLVFSAKNEAVVLNAKTLEVEKRIPASEQRTIDNVSFGTDTLLIFENPDLGDQGRLRLVSRETGKDIPCDLDGYRYSTIDFVGMTAMSVNSLSSLQMAYGIVTSTDADSNRIVILCSDDYLREFDLSTGGLLWESRGLSSQTTFAAFAADGKYILLQDERGRCSLMSADDGSVLASTLASVHSLQRLVSANDSTALLRYLERGSGDGFGIVEISTNPESFGPLTEASQAVAMTENGGAFLADGGLFFTDESLKLYSWPVLPTYSLDETISLGQTLIEGHELSEADSVVYQITH